MHEKQYSILVADPSSLELIGPEDPESNPTVINISRLLLVPLAIKALESTESPVRAILFDPIGHKKELRELMELLQAQAYDWLIIFNNPNYKIPHKLNKEFPDLHFGLYDKRFGITEIVPNTSTQTKTSN